MRIKPVTFFLVLILFCGKLFAQNNTSPYSILGIGDIETGSYGKWSGMGSAGVALSSNRYLNQLNPASLSKLDNQFFTFEFSGRYKTISYAQQNAGLGSVRSSDISMEKLALGMKLSKKWGSSVGLEPFSTSNYSFYAPKTIQGTNEQVNGYYSGSGGINKVFWSNSYSVIKNVRLGVEAAYLFGSLQQIENMTTNVASGTFVTTRNIYMTSPYLTYGLQYSGKLSKKFELAVGGTYSAKTNLNADYSYSVTDGTTSIVSEQTIKNSNYNIPSTLVAGIALSYNDKLTVASDIRHQNWTNLNYKGLNYALVNSSRYSAGVEFSKKLKGVNQSYERFFYQAGIYYNNSYLQINNEQLKDYGATLGIGVNSIRNSLGLSAALQLGARGTTNKGLIKENYTQFTFTLSYRDFWFTKGRKYD